MRIHIVPDGRLLRDKISFSSCAAAGGGEIEQRQRPLGNPISIRILVCVVFNQSISSILQSPAVHRCTALTTKAGVCPGKLKRIQVFPG